MKESRLSETPRATSPAGAEIRFLIDGRTGNMIHATVPPGQVNRAMVHATVSEFWYVMGGAGEIWRQEGRAARITPLVPGVSVDIPVGTRFQYRNTGTEPLTFLCVTMPPWPGDAEATPVTGAWAPTV